MPEMLASLIDYLIVEFGGAAGAGIAIGDVVVSYGTIAAYVITVGGSIAYSSAQNAKLRNLLNKKTDDPGRNAMIRDPLAFQRLIYGQVPVSGPIIYLNTRGTNNEYLDLIVEIAGHECAELGTIYFQNSDGFEEVPIDGSGNATDKYAGHAYFGKHLGTPGQNADSHLVGIGGLWTSAHRMAGHTYIYCELKYSPELFSDGMPLVRVMTKGKKVLDPRVGIYTFTGSTIAGNTHIPASSTASLAAGMLVVGNGILPGTRIVSIDGSGTFFTVDTAPVFTTSVDIDIACGVDSWTANTALCCADYMTDRKFGKKVPWRRINRTGLSSEANICDEDVILRDASTEKRYTLNGTTTSDQDALPELLGSMAGRVTDAGGVWTFVAGAYRTVTAPTFTDDDLVSPFQLQPRQSMRQSYSGVRGTYFSPDNQWQPGDFPAVKNDTYMKQDGNRRRWKDVSYDFIISPATAQRVSKIDLERGRQQQVFQASYKLKGFQLQCCDTIKVTRPSLGWTDKEFEILSWSLQVTTNGQGNITLAIAIIAQETTSSIYDWADGEEREVDPAPNTSLPNPTEVAAPTGLVLLADDTTALTQPDGTFVPRLLVTVDAPTDVFVAEGGRLVFEYKLASAPDSDYIQWESLFANIVSDFITNVKADEVYSVRAYFVNSVGVRSNTAGVRTYAEVTGYTVGTDSSVPGVPTGTGLSTTGIDLNVTPGFAPDANFGSRMFWVAPSDANIAYIEVKVVNTNSSAAIDYSWREANDWPMQFTTVPNALGGVTAYNGTLSPGYTFIRSVNRSGVASAWVALGNLNGTAYLSGGDAASKDVGTSAGTVAAGDDARIVAAVPNTRTINGYDLSANRTLVASDVGAVPTTRTVNGHALSADITVTRGDLSLATTDTPSFAGVQVSGSQVLSARKAAITLASGPGTLTGADTVDKAALLTLLNDHATAINTVIARMKVTGGHGLVSD